MAPRNEEAIRRRIEQRIAYVQANQNISKAKAREQFYVQTRAAELEAKGEDADLGALRRKFRSGQVSREGFYVQGEQERLQAAARARAANEAGSNTAVIPGTGVTGRSADTVRMGPETTSWTNANAAGGRKGWSGFYDQQLKPVTEFLSGTGQMLSRTTRVGSMVDRVGGWFGKDPLSDEWTRTPNVMDVALTFATLGGVRGAGKVTAKTATSSTAAKGRVGRVAATVRESQAATTSNWTRAENLANAQRVAASGRKGAVQPPKGTNWAAGVKPSKPGQNLAANVSRTTKSGTQRTTTPAPTARPAAATAGPVYGPAAPPMYGPTRANMPAASTAASKPAPTPTPGGAAASAIDDLAKRVDELVAPPQPAAKPARGKGSSGGRTKKDQTTPAPSTASAQNAQAEAQIAAGKARLKELKKERTAAKGMDDADSAAGVIDDLNRQIKETEAQLSRLKSNLGRPAGDGTPAPAPAAPSRTVTSGTKPAPSPAPTPAPSASGAIPWLNTPAATPTRGAAGGGGGARSGGGRRTDTSRGQTQPAAAETVPPARQTGSRSKKQGESAATPTESTAAPRTANVNDDTALDALWKWSRENKAAREAGTLGPRPANWKPAAERGADVAVPKNEPVRIEIEPSRAQQLARKDAEATAVGRQSTADLRAAERRRSEAGSVRTEQQRVRVNLRDKQAKLRALMDDLAEKGGADPIIQRKIDTLRKAIDKDKGSFRQLGQQRRTKTKEARQLEQSGAALREQRLDYVGRPEAGPRMDQTQGRTRAAQDAYDSSRGSLDDLINPMDLD